MENLVFALYGSVCAVVFWLLYYLIKMTCIKRLSGFIVFLHVFFVVCSVYPVISAKSWNEDFWIVFATSELCLLIFTFTGYRLDLKNRRLYEILNRNKMITLFSGTYSIPRQVGTEKISEKLELLFPTNDKYRVPYNMVVISMNGNNKGKMGLHFIFWNADDYNKFIASNKYLVIEECKKKKYGIYLAASIICN